MRCFSDMFWNYKPIFTVSLPKSKCGSCSSVFNLMGSGLGEKIISHLKCGIFHPTRSSHYIYTCCIATRLCPVHCHIINIQTFKYQFPTLCTWGVMQLPVNPIWSTILHISREPAQRGLMNRTLSRQVKSSIYVYEILHQSPEFRNTDPRQIWVRCQQAQGYICAKI